MSALFATSDQTFQEAAEANRRSDHFLLMTVLFAGTLFPTGVPPTSAVRRLRCLCSRSLGSFWSERS